MLEKEVLTMTGLLIYLRERFLYAHEHRDPQMIAEVYDTLWVLHGAAVNDRDRILADLTRRIANSIDAICDRGFADDMPSNESIEKIMRKRL